MHVLSAVLKIFTKFDGVGPNINYLSGFFLSNLEEIINIRYDAMPPEFILLRMKK